MKKAISTMLVASMFCLTTISAQEPLYMNPKILKSRAKAASSNPYYTAAASMAVWGVALAVGIGILCVSLDKSESATTTQ
jgi:hypothetical protein